MYKLLNKAKKGDSESITEIINLFKPLILKEASKYKIKSYGYEDLVQHGYLSVIKAVNMYKGEPKYFKAYCIKAIKNNLKALLKGQIKHYREVENEDIENLGEDNYLFTIEDEIIAYEEIKELYIALGKLDVGERKVVDEFYTERKSLNEIAVSGNKSYHSIRYIKNKAIKKLQKQLQKHI